MVEFALGAALGTLVTILLRPRHSAQKALVEAQKVYEKTLRVAEEAKEVLRRTQMIEQRLLGAGISEEDRAKILASLPDAL